MASWEPPAMNRARRRPGRATRGGTHLSSLRSRRRTGIPDPAKGHFVRQAHAVLFEGQGDLAAVMRITRNEIAHPANRFALKKLDALSRLQPFAEEGVDGRGRGAESGGQARAVELCVTVEWPSGAGEACAIVFEPAGVNLPHGGHAVSRRSARAKRAARRRSPPWGWRPRV